MKKLSINDLKIIKINENTYQIEAGKKAIVIRAKSPQDALKNACKYYCNKNSLNLNG